MRPTAVRVVVITDRRLADGADAAARLRAILAAVPRGSVLVQVRAKEVAGCALVRFASLLREVTAAAGAPLWVNDRVDVACAVGADGVHLPERGLPPDDARRVARMMGRSLAVGVSRHVAGAVDADLVQLGQIWSTPSKAGMGAPLGVGALAIRVGAGTHLVAVGGIDGPGRAAAAFAAGADAVAVIRAAWTGPDPAALIAALVAVAPAPCTPPTT